MAQRETNEDDPAIPTIAPSNKNEKKENKIKQIYKDKMLFFILILIPFITIPGIYFVVRIMIKFFLTKASPTDAKIDTDNFFKIEPIENLEMYGSLNNFLDMPVEQMDKAIEIEEKIKNSEIVEEQGARERLILVTGNTGTGKSFFVKQFAYYIYNKFKNKGDKRTISLIHITPGHLSETSDAAMAQNLASIFKYIKENEKKKLVILAFDDIDGLFEIIGDEEDINIHIVKATRDELLNKLGSDKNIDTTPFIALFCSVPPFEEIAQRWSRRCGNHIDFNKLCLEQQEKIVERYCKLLNVKKLSNLPIFEEERVYSIVEIMEMVDNNLPK